MKYLDCEHTVLSLCTNWSVEDLDLDIDVICIFLSFVFKFLYIGE